MNYTRVVRLESYSIRLKKKKNTEKRHRYNFDKKKKINKHEKRREWEILLFYLNDDFYWARESHAAEPLHRVSRGTKIEEKNTFERVCYWVFFTHMHLKCFRILNDRFGIGKRTII